MTATYAIAELAEGESGGYAPRGAVLQLWHSREFEVMVSGPADTGKTWGCLEYLDGLMWQYPGAHGVIARKTYAALIGSALQTYRRILGPDTPVEIFGGAKPQWYDYPNGSRIWVAGLDTPGKSLSSERDVIYINQAEELTLEDWEMLTTRCTGRAGTMPQPIIYGDCNPSAPSHWIKHRAGLRLLESRHEDNPALFDEQGDLLPEGAKRIAVLDALTGVRKERLRFGRWRQAEGAVYEEWDRAVHVLPAKDRAVVLASASSFVGGVDWGLTNPGVLLVFAVDGDGRMTLVREVYRTGQLIGWWTEQARELQREYHVHAWYCDPAQPAYIMQFQNAGLPAIEAFNDIAPGIGAVAGRLLKAADGRPRLCVLEDAALIRDEELAAKRKPLGLIDEMEQYSWPKAPDGKALKEVPVDDANHAEDACRYAVAGVDGLTKEPANPYAGLGATAAAGAGVVGWGPGRRR